MVLGESRLPASGGGEGHLVLVPPALARQEGKGYGARGCKQMEEVVEERLRFLHLPKIYSS